MSPIIGPGGAGGGGGGGLTLGPTPNEFTAASRSAAETLRDAESAAWLAQYDDEPTFTIALNWPATPTNTIYQSRRGGSWADVTGLVRGRPGATGAAGAQARFLVYAYINAAAAPTAAPTGGTFVRSTGTLTVPIGYTSVPATPATGSGTYRAEAIVNPAVDTDTVTLTWSVPAELPAYAVVALAQDAATEAELARDLAQQYAGQAQDIPAGSPRGVLVATTPTLPTAATGSNSVIAFGTAELWTVEADAPDGFEAGPAANNERLYLPDIHPAGTNGTWVVVEVNGVEIAEVFISHGGIQGATGADRRLLLPVSVTADALIRVGFWQRSTVASYIQLTGNSDTLPANTVVKVYTAVVRGAAGSGGGGGGGGTVSTDSTIEGDGSAGNPLGLADDAVATDKLDDGAVTVAKMDSGSATDGHVATADGAGGVAFEAQSGGGGGTVSTDATLDGDGSAGDPLSLADDAVTTAKIAASAVHTGKINDDAVTADKLADDAVHHDSIVDNAVRADNIQAMAVETAKLDDGAVTVDKMDSGSATDGHVATADGAGGVAYEAPTGGGGGGAITTEAPVSGDGSAGDPVTIANQAIGHTKLGSSVGGVNQASGRILEADGAGDMRWANKGGGGGGDVPIQDEGTEVVAAPTAINFVGSGVVVTDTSDVATVTIAGGGSGGSGEALTSIDFPTPDSTNVYDVIDHLGVLYRNLPTLITGTVTWTASGDGDDVSDLWGEQSGTYRFRGIQATSGVSSPLSGDVVLLPAGGFRHRGATRWSHLGSPQGWVGGPYADEDEADSHATALNDVSAFDNAMQLVTAFTAGTTEYAWFTGDDPAFLVSRVLGTPTVERLYELQNFLGELYRVEPRPNGHVVTWDDYALLADVSTLWGESSGTYRWRGETYPSGVINPATGDVIKEPAGHFRHRNSSNAWVHLADPGDFIGDYNTETDADNHVTAVGQTSLYSHLLHQVATFTAGVTTYVWAKGLDAREVTVDGHAFGGNLATTDTDVQLVADKVDGLILGPSISDDDPQNIGDTADAGTGAEVLAEDHVHALPIDNTLEFDGSDQLGVNIHDVIEHLQERIRYYTAASDYSSSAGASVGQTYNTSQYDKVITKVEALFNPLGGADEYLIRLVDTNDDNSIKAKIAVSNTRSTAGGTAGVRAFNFHDGAGEVGVRIDGGIRIGILLSRLGDNSDSATQAVHGSEAGNSPGESYGDASIDFDLVNDVVYQHIDPAVNASTHSHGTDIRGNFKIFYTLIIDHGSLVGDGNVNAAHIDSETADDGDVLTADGSGGASWETPSGGGGGGGGYGDWADIGSVTGAISGNPVTVTLDTGETIDDYEELYVHIEANDTNDQRVVSPRFRASDVPETTLAGGGLGLPFAGNATDEGAVLVRRNADGDSLVLDVYGSVINFPTTSVTTIYARTLTTGGGGGGATDAEDVAVDTTNFDGNLTAADDDVQSALETIDGFTQYQGNWQQAAWPAGVIVRRSGIAYLSLVNNNTEIPTPASTQWSGLPEGFTYRGEAPVLATNYNYGQVVLEPDTGVYYYFTSTISASVARADIATHANFHAIGGELTQATEATLGGVQGASALQAISSSGTDILGWTINRLQQFLSVSLPTMAQSDIDNATTGRKAVTGALIADNAGGGTNLTQAQVEDETDTTFGSVSGERLSQAVAAFESGGGDTPDRIVLADAVGVSNTAGPHEITLTEAMVPRRWLSFFMFTTTGASPDGIGYLLSDDILALTAEATAPTDAENALPVVTASYSASNFSQQSGNYFVYRKDDSTLWVRPTRLAAHTLTITGTPMGGGLTTAEQQAISNAKVLVSDDFAGAGNALNAHSNDDAWTMYTPNIHVVTAVEYDSIERIDLVLEQNGKADLPFVITRGMLDEIQAGAFMPNSPANSQRIRGVFHAGRIAPGSRNQNYWTMTPRYDFMNERRDAGDNCILIQYGLNGTLFTALYFRIRQPSGSLSFKGAKLWYWEDA